MTADTQPDTRLYWIFRPCNTLGDKTRWYIYSLCTPGISISWGGAPLLCVDAATAEHVRATGKLLPKDAT